MNELMVQSSLTNVLKALEYQDDKGLVTTDTSEIDGGREFVWKEVRDKFEIHAAYFHGNVPVVYFREFQEFNNETLWKLHRSLWNHNRAPILIAVLPNEVRIYNCFRLPARDQEEFKDKNPRLLERVVGQVSDHRALSQQLSNYKRREIISGRFAKEQRSRFNRKERVDERLLNNLRDVRRWLKNEGLDFALVNRLLGRCIFVRYLEDRCLLEDSKSDLFEGSDGFMDLLETSKDEVYRCFKKLSDRFNGDLFPVNENEIRLVEEFHLRKLGQFFKATEVISGQMCFWAYDFNYIPIELISAIYETFLDRDETVGVHYTPPKIVDFVLSEILPFDTRERDIKILDPACGSGIFLIEAYRRLVFLRSRKNRRLKFKELCNLLKDSIFGVDVDEGAIGVAIFSCYLALLDFLSSDDVQKDMKLPNLKGTNLFVKDFFDTKASFNNHRYDIIVGNPPWKRKMDRLSHEFKDRTGHYIAGNQIAQAFLWRVPELLAEDGQACLLCPSMSVLFNRHDNYVNFRHEFFERNWVTKVVDFSALRHELFLNAVAPMTAIFYRKDFGTDNKKNIAYIGLHRSPLSELLEGIVVYGDEIKPLPYRRVFDHPNIWKMALWGTPRDLEFINELRERFSCSTLEKVSNKRNWEIGPGVTVGNRKYYKPCRGKIRFVPTKAIENLSVSSGEECRIGECNFERPRDDEYFQGPHVLIRGTASKGFLNAAFLPDEAVFKNRVYVIKGPPNDANHLKVVSAILSSSLARYYHFLTSSEWGIERPVILLNEYKDFPCPILDENDDLFKEVVNLVNRVQQTGTYTNWRSDLDILICKIYDLTSSEQQIMEDFMETGIDIHHSGIMSNAFRSPSLEDLHLYAQTYENVFVSMTGKANLLSSSVHEGDSSYQAISFHLASESMPRQPEGSVLDFNDHLAKLERIAIEQHGQDLYFLKNIRVYENEEIHILKPNERRFWTRSAAYNDADGTIAELLKASNQQ